MKILSYIVVLASLTSCVSVGIIEGKVRETRERAVFGYRGKNIDGVISDVRYNGMAIMENARAFGLGISFNPFASSWSSAVFPTISTGSGRGWESIATLFGEDEGSARCNLQLNKAGTMRKGGVGICQMSDGRTMDLIIHKGKLEFI